MQGLRGLLSAIFFFYLNSLNAQDYYEDPVKVEVGTSVGMMNSFTDLGGNRGITRHGIGDFVWKFANVMGSTFMTTTYQNMVAVTVETTWGKVRGYDSILKTPEYINDKARQRYIRNLSFQSSIFEVGTKTEIHPVEIFTNEINGYTFSPYMICGVGYFKFNPQTYYEGTWYDLQPLHTEGEGFDEYPDRKVYSLEQTNLLVGMGFKYDINDLSSVRLEFVYRKLNTDYLDDVSTRYIKPELFARYLGPADAAIAVHVSDRRKETTSDHQQFISTKRGNPETNDAYFTFSLKYSMAIVGVQRINPFSRYHK